MSDFMKTTIDKVLKDPGTQKMMREHISSAIIKSIDDTFKSYNPVGKAIQEKIISVMVPYIEKYDFSSYLPKLDIILQNVLAKDQPGEYRTIMDNFKNLMITPDERTVTMSEIFTEYIKHVGQDISTYHLKTSVDDEGCPCYEPFGVTMEINDITSEHSCIQRYEVNLYHEFRNMEKDYCYTFMLTRFKRDSDDTDHSDAFEYDLRLELDPSIHSLAKLNDFQVYLLNLYRYNVKVTDVRDDILEDEAMSDEVPDLRFQ